MIKRLLSALILIPLVLWVITSSNPIFLVAIVSMASIILAYEVISFNTKDVNYLHLAFISLLLFALYLFKYLLLIGIMDELSYNRVIFFLTLLSVILPGMIEVFKGSFEPSIKRMGLSLLSFVYMGIIFSHIIDLRFMSRFLEGDFLDSTGIIYLIYIFTTAWMYDAGGYFIGKYFGKRKIGLPASPNKSWAGFIGGIIFSVIGYFIWYSIMDSVYPQETAQSIFKHNHGLGVLLSICIAVFSQCGDLIESVYKRSAGVKDSGHLIAGHGGVFDAIDSVIPTGCLFFYVLLFL